MAVESNAEGKIVRARDVAGASVFEMQTPERGPITDRGKPLQYLYIADGAGQGDRLIHPDFTSIAGQLLVIPLIRTDWMWSCDAAGAEMVSEGIDGRAYFPL
jgi:hypothetical protein